MRPELHLILSSAKLHPTVIEQNTIKKRIEEVEDWDYFINTIIERGLAPLFYKKLPLLGAILPARVEQLLKKTYYTTVSRNMVIYDAFKELCLVFKMHNNDFLALKGIFLAEWLYGDIGLRQMSDIDLLIREEDAAKAIAAMEQIGYHVIKYKTIVSESADKLADSVVDKDEAAHLPPMLKGILSVELHTKLQYKREEYKQETQEIWDSSRFVTLNGNTVRVLDFYQQIIHICLHLHRHTGEHVQFTCYSDIVVFLEKFKDEINWDVLIETCVKNGYEVPVFRYMLLAHEYMGAYLPDNIIEQYSYTVTEIDRDIFYKHLTGFDFLDVPIESAVPAHFQNIKLIKNPLLKLRYVWEVVFPGKEFMVEKYSPLNPPQGGLKSKSQDGASVTSSYHHIITSKFWWLWYGYRWAMGLKGLWLVITRKTEEKKTSPQPSPKGEGDSK